MHLTPKFASYRVNIFGFPNAAGLEDQNLGLLDQRLAYEMPLHRCTRLYIILSDILASSGSTPMLVTLGVIQRESHSGASQPAQPVPVFTHTDTPKTLS